MNYYIKYGGWAFLPSDITSGNIHLAAALISDALEVDSLVVSVVCNDPAILEFARNEKLEYIAASGRKTVWRVQNIERIGPTQYRISATSTLGLLCDGIHYGGIYTGQTAESVILDICGGVPVVVKTNLREVKLYGWLPIAAPRDNLSQVLFAIGATLKSDMNGVLRVLPLWDGVGWAVEKNRMYVESKATYSAPITSVIVTEHQYFKANVERELYNGESVEGNIVTFGEPMHSIRAQGFKVLDSGANWAKLSAGTGSLYGQAYIHNTREISRKVSDGSEQNIKKVENATLVSYFNSDFVAQRLASFCRCRQTIDAPVTYQGELPGDVINTFHPFDLVDVSACIQSEDITLSNVIKAKGKSLVGFVPSQTDNTTYYDMREVFLTNGNWTVPYGVKSIRIILIGGGDGGQGGSPGREPIDVYGDPAWYYSYGGAGGSAGSGGAVYQTSIDVTPGDVYAIVIGAGGAGGSISSALTIPPGAGSPTTFTRVGAAETAAYSSAQGSTNQNGFKEPSTGELYAVGGKDGVSGGDGGSGGSISTNRDPDGKDGSQAAVEGSPSVPYLGGAGGKGMTFTSSAQKIYIAAGGGGGGGAYGQKGGAGGDGHRLGSGLPVVGGNGGNGATPVMPDIVSTRGGGGNGGHGGGGRGAIGTTYDPYNINDPGGTSDAIWGTPGRQGEGSPGRDGAPGIAIIYYQQTGTRVSGLFRTKDEKSFLDRFGRRFVV